MGSHCSCRSFERVVRAASVFMANGQKPEGASEMMQTVVLQRLRHLAVFGANRHASGGELTDTELGIVLVPHIRGAVAIGDVLDAKKIKLHTLAATLDSFNAGIVIVADQGQILHAHESAREMLSKRETIAAVGGILSVRDPRAECALADAIDLAGASEANIGERGIGSAGRRDSGPRACASVGTRRPARTRRPAGRGRADGLRFLRHRCWCRTTAFHLRKRECPSTWHAVRASAKRPRRSAFPGTP